ncbi:STM4015 family protein [Actinoplanes sp. CA-142083]|uniref:STM4015 family protein n=1 Tax=Actinoplanes sp. CA-142083 TaxID=3239903 RepID=UPI003D8ECEBC
MTINSNLTTFAGLPIVAWNDEDNAPDDPGAVAWRLEVEDFDADAAEIERAFEELLKRVGDGGPVALVVGEWGGAYEREFPIDLLVRNASRLSRLRALFVAELTYEQCEISWLKLGDITPLLEAFPRLERLWVRGADGLALTPVRHEGLRELVLQSGGLPVEVVRAVAACDFPSLTHLELWLGVSNYGGDARADDLAPILAGQRLPALTSLGVRNAEIADEVAAAVAAAPVVARLTELDLSMGAMSDAGGEALLTGQPLTHLTSLSLSHHFMTEELAQRLVEELPGVRVDVSDRQQEEEWGRYTAVAE